MQTFWKGNPDFLIKNVNFGISNFMWIFKSNWNSVHKLEFIPLFAACTTKSEHFPIFCKIIDQPRHVDI
jgi:hypothetical protein